MPPTCSARFILLLLPLLPLSHALVLLTGHPNATALSSGGSLAPTHSHDLSLTAPHTHSHTQTGEDTSTDTSTDTATATFTTVIATMTTSTTEVPGTDTDTAMDTRTATPSPLVTAFPAGPSPIHCDVAYCSSGTSYCHFWAGVSSWDHAGPQPGEVRTALGSCDAGVQTLRG